MDPIETMLREVKGAVERSTEASSKAEGAAREATAAAVKSTQASNAVANGLADLQAEVMKNSARTAVLERFVFGSDPPPRPGSIPDDGWLEEQAKKSPKSPAVIPTLARIESETVKQSSYLGLGVHGLAKIVGTREGRAALIGLAVAISAFISGKVTSNAPPPPAAPAVQVVRVEVPASVDAGSTPPPPVR